jgi:hypothetical protein
MKAHGDRADGGKAAKRIHPFTPAVLSRIVPGQDPVPRSPDTAHPPRYRSRITFK